MSTPDQTTSEEQWNQFEAMIELHKFYFDQILKAAGFALATVSALTTYIVRTIAPTGSARAPLLLLPIVFAGATAAVFWIAVKKTREFSADVVALQTTWGYRWRPHTELLSLMALVFAVIFSMLALGMGVYGWTVMAPR